MTTEPADSRSSTPDAASAPGPSSVLRLDGVTVRLAGRAIVADVSLALEAGDLALLAGPNGAGKSTLLRAAVNLLPSSGDIEICGFHPASLEARSRFVFVPDEPALYEDLTLEEHVRFTALVYDRPDAEERAFGWLERFGLAGRVAEFPSTHSRGMRQKLALALALGLEVPLLVLDEPFNGLDGEAQGALVEALRARAAAGGTVLLTAHQGELVRELRAQALELRDGMLQRASVAPDGGRA